MGTQQPCRTHIHTAASTTTLEPTQSRQRRRGQQSSSNRHDGWQLRGQRTRCSQARVITRGNRLQLMLYAWCSAGEVKPQRVALQVVLPAECDDATRPLALVRSLACVRDGVAHQSRRFEECPWALTAPKRSDVARLVARRVTVGCVCVGVGEVTHSTISMSVDLPVVDLDAFLADPASPLAREQCRIAAEGLHQFGLLIVRDSRVSDTDNNRW